jgi:hypothetical protein
VFDCILRGLRYVYTINPKTQLVNLCIQLDNTNYNKGYGLLSALASLVQNGIVKKVRKMKINIYNLNYKIILYNNIHADQSVLLNCCSYAYRRGCSDWNVCIVPSQCGMLCMMY